MRKKFLSALLAVSLVCGMAGCGKSEGAAGEAAGGDAVDYGGISGGGDAVDYSGGQTGGNASDLTGMPEEGNAQGRTQVQEDFVIVKVPTITYEDFGNGFYDEYVVDTEPLSGKTYDEDGLLTGATIYFENMLDPLEGKITLSYEKDGGMVTGCQLSADMYAWYLSDQYVLYLSNEEAREENQESQKRMPYRLVFEEPVAADPDAVKAAVLAAIDASVAQLNKAILPPTRALDFCEAFSYMYLEAMGDAGQTETGSAEETVSLKELSYDEDGLLTKLRVNLEGLEFWVELEYEKDGGLVTACELNAELYAFFVKEYGLDEEEAQVWNAELSAKMPVRLVFDEPVEPDSAMVGDMVQQKLGENIESDADGILTEFSYILFATDWEGEFSGGTDSEAGMGGSIDSRFQDRMEGKKLAVNCIGGGNLSGEVRISNDPGWVIGMSVAHEDIICQIETEQDSNGNLTLVHLYNDYAVYDNVYTYDSAGRMIRSEHYEYPKGQSREAVGALWYTEYSYDSAGRLVKKQETSNQDNGVNAGTEVYYDDMGRVATRIDTTHYFGNDFMTMQQTYDSVTQSYEYDDSGKVALVTVTVDWAQTPIHPEPPEPTTVRYVPEK